MRQLAPTNAVTGLCLLCCEQAALMLRLDARGWKVGAGARYRRRIAGMIRNIAQRCAASPPIVIEPPQVAERSCRLCSISAIFSNKSAHASYRGGVRYRSRIYASGPVFIPCCYRDAVRAGLTSCVPRCVHFFTLLIRLPSRHFATLGTVSPQVPPFVSILTVLLCSSSHLMAVVPCGLLREQRQNISPWACVWCLLDHLWSTSGFIVTFHLHNLIEHMGF